VPLDLHAGEYVVRTRLSGPEGVEDGPMVQSGQISIYFDGLRPPFQGIGGLKSSFTMQMRSQGQLPGAESAEEAATH